MPCHITEDQRKAIIAMSKKGINPLDISNQLEISLRTVKTWYKSKDDSKTSDTSLSGLGLYCLQELSRLFCWPAPRIAKCLETYIPILISKKVEINSSIQRLRAKPYKRGEALVTARTVQRYLAACNINQNVRKAWGDGVLAVHAVKIVWWKHNQDNWIKKVGNKSVKTVGWLLMMAERKINNNTLNAKFEQKVKFQLLSEEQFDSKQVIESISTACHFHFNEPNTLYTLYRVTNEQGEPTAVSALEKLRSHIRFNIDDDKPTKANGSIIIPASFPNRKSVENYLAIILANKAGTPDFRDRGWMEVHKSIGDDNFVKEKLGKLWPFLVRENPNTP
jgi:hypothetical protein